MADQIRKLTAREALIKAKSLTFESIINDAFDAVYGDIETEATYGKTELLYKQKTDELKISITIFKQIINKVTQELLDNGYVILKNTIIDDVYILHIDWSNPVEKQKIDKIPRVEDGNYKNNPQKVNQ